MSADHVLSDDELKSALADLPDWEEAHRRMATEGRRSKVRHPSEAHQDFRIPPPRF